MKKIVCFLSVTLFILVFTLNVNSFAADYRSTVRIGLNYGSDSVASVRVSAVKGFDVGFYNNDNFQFF